MKVPDSPLFRAVFAAAPGPMMIHEPESGVVVEANDAACDLLKLDHEELVGTEVGAFSPPEYTTDDAEQMIQEAAAEGGATVDWVVEGPDGDQRLVEVTLRRTGANEDTYVAAYIDDVTEHRERDRQQTERDEQLEALVDNLPVVVFTLDPDGVFTHSAGKGLESLGLDQGELQGVSVFDAYADYPDVTAAARHALDGNEVRSTQPIENLVFETWYRPVYDGDELTQVVGVARDITDLKRREERVERLSSATNELLYTHTEADVAATVTNIARQIIDRPIAAMWAYDEDDDMLYPIGATADATSFADAEAPNQLPPMGPETDEKAIFDTGEPTVVEDYQELDTPSAPGVPLRTLLCLPLEQYGLLCIGSSEVEEFSETEQLLLEVLASTATAALERVEREATMERQRAELKRSNQALKRRTDHMEFFNSILRHDMLNGMNVIRARGELLEDDLHGDHRDYAETIVKWSDDIIDLTQKVRSVLETLSEDGMTESENRDLADVLDAAADRARSVSRDCTVTNRVNHVDVAADELLEDVFGNIFLNAVEHGGDDVHIDVHATADDDWVTIRIADDGPGISPGQRRRVFERGEKGSGSSGTGFGLYFVDSMVESYGGQIWIEESEAGGAAFVIELPRTE